MSDDNKDGKPGLTPEQIKAFIDGLKKPQLDANYTDLGRHRPLDSDEGAIDRYADLLGQNKELETYLLPKRYPNGALRLIKGGQKEEIPRTTARYSSLLGGNEEIWREMLATGSYRPADESDPSEFRKLLSSGPALFPNPSAFDGLRPPTHYFKVKTDGGEDIVVVDTNHFSEYTRQPPSQALLESLGFQVASYAESNDLSARQLAELTRRKVKGEESLALRVNADLQRYFPQGRASTDEEALAVEIGRGEHQFPVDFTYMPRQEGEKHNVVLLRETSLLDMIDRDLDYLSHKR